MNLNDALMKLAADPPPLVDPDTAKSIGDRARTLLGSKDPASAEQLRLTIGRGRAGFGFGPRIPDRTVLERMAGSGTAPTGGFAGRMLNKLPGIGEPDAEKITGTSTAKAPTTGSYNTYEWGGLGAAVKRQTSIGRTFTEGQRAGIRATLDSPEFKGREWLTGKPPAGAAKPVAAPAAPAAPPAAAPTETQDAKGVAAAGAALDAWHKDSEPAKPAVAPGVVDLSDPKYKDSPNTAPAAAAPAQETAPAAASKGPLSAPETPNPETYKKPMTWSAPSRGPSFGAPTKSWSPHG